jgi:hypothetical protein
MTRFADFLPRSEAALPREKSAIVPVFHIALRPAAGFE